MDSQREKDLVFAAERLADAFVSIAESVKYFRDKFEEEDKAEKKKASIKRPD